MNISIIIRTLGRASLAQAIESVAAQGRSDVEVIVVDAAGQLQLPPVSGVPVRVVGNGQRLHRSVAASMGLAAVNTRWAGFLDDDDLLLAGHLDKLAAALQAAPDAVLAHSGVELVRQVPPAAPGVEGPATPETEAKEPRVLLTFDTPFEPWELLLGNRMPIHASLFDASRAQAAGAHVDSGLDIYEDWDFWLQLRQLGPFVHAPGVTARYIVGEDASGVHAVQYGDDAYWRVWTKWWPRAPRAWWVDAFHAGARLGPVSQELADTRRHLAGQIDAQQVRIAAALEEVERLRLEIATQVQALEQSRALAAEVRLQRDALSASLLQAEDSLAARTAELDALREQLGSTLQALDRALRSVEETQAALLSRNAELQDTRQVLGRSEALLSQQRLETQRVVEELQALRESRFWRMTAPLRSLVDRARQLRLKLAAARRGSAWRRLAVRAGTEGGYARWIREVESAQVQRRSLERVDLPELLFSVLMPVYNPRLALLDEAIESLRAQQHGAWELCLADDASTDAGVREQLRAWAARESRIRLVERPTNGHISAASNSALALARGSWVVLLDQDDLLAPDALVELASAIAAHPDAGLLYSDEDKLDGAGRRFEPYFKPAFNLELLRGQNLISHLGAYRRSLVLEVGGFREGYEGSQDHDLALRCAERLTAAQVVHIPRVLYHWRAAAGSTAAGSEQKPYAVLAAQRAVQDHLNRTAPGSAAETLPGTGHLRVRLALPASLPAVRAVAVVPALDAAADAWARAVRESAGHAGFEVQLRLPSSTPGEAGLAAFVREAADASEPLLLHLRFGLLPARTGWLEEMISQACRPGVGIVGARVETASGALADGCLIAGPQVAWQGLARRKGGYFGRALLCQAVSAVGPSAMMVRRDAVAMLLGTPAILACQGEGLDAAWHLCEAVRGRGLRVVWTPFAVLVEGEAARPVPAMLGAAAAAVDDAACHPQLTLAGGALTLRQEPVPLRPRPGF